MRWDFVEDGGARCLIRERRRSTRPARRRRMGLGVVHGLLLMIMRLGIGGVGGLHVGRLAVVVVVGHGVAGVEQASRSLLYTIVFVCQVSKSPRSKSAGCGIGYESGQRLHKTNDTPARVLRLLRIASQSQSRWPLAPQTPHLLSLAQGRTPADVPLSVAFVSISDHNLPQPLTS